MSAANIQMPVNHDDPACGTCRFDEHHLTMERHANDESYLEAGDRVYAVVLADEVRHVHHKSCVDDGATNLDSLRGIFPDGRLVEGTYNADRNELTDIVVM